MFLILEGLDYAGKTTLLPVLRAHYERQGREVVSLRAPGGTPVGALLREALLHPTTRFADPYARQQVFLADHRELLTAAILPALDAGKVVLLDRWLDSTRAYACGGLQLETHAVEALVEAQVLSALRGRTLRQLTLYLDIPVTTLARRRAASGARNALDTLDLPYYQRVRDAYRTLLRPGTHHAIAAQYPAHRVAAQALRALQQYDAEAA